MNVYSGKFVMRVLTFVYTKLDKDSLKNTKTG